MVRPIHSAGKFAEFGSYDSLAQGLMERFPAVQWGVIRRSLGAKIGELDKGKVTWWANNPEKARCLAEFLEIPLEDFGLHGKAEKGAFLFQDFPEFPPLDVRREELPLLFKEVLDPEQVSRASSDWNSLEEWLGNAAGNDWHPPTGMNWLCIADELQRQLLSRKLAVSGRHEVLMVETLHDAAVRLCNPKPLIVVVRHDAGKEDLQALAGRPRDAGIMVVAPFMLDRRKESSSVEFLSWESRTAKGLQGRVFDLTARDGIKCWTLVVLPDWRERLLQWVEARINRFELDTHFSAQAVGDWLKDFDPLSVWFRTTSDILQLCRLVHFDSEKRLPDPGGADAGNHLTQLLFAGKPSLEFQINQLADARWLSADQPWDGDLPLAVWCSLSVTGVASVSGGDLGEIVSGKTQAEREKAAERVASMLEAGSPDALLRSGLLRESRQDCFDFRHRCFADLLVRDRLMREIAAEPLDTWASSCFDPGRRPLVDAVMAVLPTMGLSEVARCLASVPAESAQAIAVSEALFVAIGKRIVRGEDIPPSLLPIADLVISRLDFSGDVILPQPWSRSLASDDEQLAWIGACWSWSLLPETMRPIEPSWLFPGWAEALPDVPYWLSLLLPDDKDEHVPKAFTEFLMVLRQWSKELDAPIENAPAVFILPFLDKAAHGVLAVEAGWWKGLVGRKWAEKLLLDSFEKAGEGAAARLWPSFLAVEQELEQVKEADDKYNFPHLRWRFSPLRVWLLEHLTPMDMLKGLSQDALRYLGRYPESLPPGVRSLLLQSLLDCYGDQEYFDVWSFLDRSGFHAAPALKACLEHENFRFSAVQCLWRWDAKQAVSLLVHGEEIALEARKVLLQECPVQYFPRALEVVEKMPELLDADAEWWVRRYLPTAGRFAERAYALLGVRQK